MANLLRLYLHAAAANLLVRVRQVAADPPPPASPTDLPTEALAGKDRPATTSITDANGTRWGKDTLARGALG